MADTISSPSRWLTAMEVRAIGERAQMSVLLPALRRLPVGDGHPVLVLPGFSAGDRSTSALRSLLKDLGYRTYSWGLGPNMGPSTRVREGLARRLDHAFRRREPVSIIGWSLGGIYARELARTRPDQVRQVITLGSPIQMAEADSSPRQPLTVPATSIYSRTDGVVSWQASLIRRTDIGENVRVVGSHCGLGHNPAAIAVIADRLAQPSGTWSHFSAPWYLRGAFPPSTDLGTSRHQRSTAA